MNFFGPLILALPLLAGPASAADPSSSSGSAVACAPGAACDLSGMSVTATGGSVARTQAARATDAVQVVDYGAKCDGTTDDAAAIIAATNVAAVTLGGRDVVFPAGTCRLLNFIAPPSNTRWVSRSETTIYLDPAMKTGHPIGGQSHGIAFDGVSNILIDGITFAGGGTARASTCTKTSCPNLIAQNTSNVVIRNATIRDFGSPAAYSQGLLVFGGHDWLVDHSAIINTSGDNLAFSNASYNVEVRNSTFNNSFGDSALVCTIGGYNFNFHDNHITQGSQPAKPQVPVIVMDRCHAWQISNNQITGTPNASGVAAGQGIRVARYADTPETNHDFTIIGNTITGTDTAISVEASGTVQGSQSVPGGGRFAVVGNTSTGANTCIQINNSEMGAVSGNACTGVALYGLLEIAYAGKTGSLAIGTNTFVGTGASGSFGVRQLGSGGTITPSAVAPQFATNFAVNYALDASNAPIILPVVTRSASAACTPGELSLNAAGNALQACVAHGSVKSVPVK
ncbi:hypothetical protein JHFBIEKO_3089 [Methylobacterium mesophilicum]|nr:hypothetical protein JHFBIEKO_3089 [Methylobacterium mesophilicum]